MQQTRKFRESLDLESIVSCQKRQDDVDFLGIDRYAAGLQVSSDESDNKANMRMGPKMSEYREHVEDLASRIVETGHIDVH
jgi:hypothetical protein